MRWPPTALVIAAAAVGCVGCGGGGTSSTADRAARRPVTVAETRVALERAVVGRCRPTGADGRRFHCRLPRFGGAVAEMTVDDHGTFRSGPLPFPPARHSIPAGLGGMPRRMPPYAGGGVTEIWGCCVPVPPRPR